MFTSERRLLAVENLAVDYGGYVALSGVSLEVRTGEIVCLMGANGSGKSSLLNAVSGLVRPAAGTVVFEGRSLTDVPTYRRLGLGLAHVLERRRLFPYMTVLENLLLGSYLPAARARRGEALEQVFRTFPELRARRQQLAHTLSGGEQQMVAIARALMSTPRFLMLDEPSLGLAPLLVKTIFEKIVEINRQHGITILLVEQNANLALEVSHFGYVLETGRIILQGQSPALRQNPQVRSAYLGGI